MPSPIPESAKNQNLSEKTITALSERPFDESVPLEKVNKTLFAAGVIGFLLLILASVGIYYLSTKVQPEGKATKVSVNTQEAPVTTSLSKDKITLEILNGSGVAGAAAKTAKSFTDLGYSVVKTGNTTAADKNTILVNKDLKGSLDQFFEDTQKELGIGTSSGDLLDSTAAARIILGTK